MRAIASACVVAAGVIVGSCGPSLRMVHQSDTYFERCHGADHDAAVTMNERHACWAAWLEHYTLGQPSDRVVYALDRLDALERGESATALPGLRGDEGAIPLFSEALPEESTPSEPESAEAGGTPARAPDLPVADPARRPPPHASDACERTCAPLWQTCTEGCASHTASCLDACDSERRICTRGCYP